MKKMPTYKLVAICIGVVGILGMVILSVVLNKNLENTDPVIVGYKEAINVISNDTDTYHASEIVETFDANGELLYKEEKEYYNTNECFAVLWTESNNSVCHMLVTQEADYYYTLDASGEVYIVREENGVGSYKRPWFGMSDTYFFITDKNVSYIETEEQYIVTYADTLKDKQSYMSNGETVEHICESAVSVCYFDKDWNVQKIVLTEEWRIVMEDGTEEVETEITTITYLDTSDEDVEKKLEEEKKFMESLLK